MMDRAGRRWVPPHLKAVNKNGLPCLVPLEQGTAHPVMLLLREMVLPARWERGTLQKKQNKKEYRSACSALHVCGWHAVTEQ